LQITKPLSLVKLLSKPEVLLGILLLVLSQTLMVVLLLKVMNHGLVLVDTNLPFKLLIMLLMLLVEQLLLI